MSDHRSKDKMIDVLLSGTTATLVIQTPQKVYIGWIGDSLVAMLGSEKRFQVNSKNNPKEMFLNYPSHTPNLNLEK